MIKKSFIGIILLLFSASHLYAVTARELMEKNDSLAQPKTVKSSVTMKIYRNNKLRETKQFMMYSIKQGKETKTLIKFIKPTKIKFLTHSKSGGNDLQWIKTRSGKPKRITGGEKGKSFVHSHFYYEDLTVKNINEYTYSLQGEADVSGTRCYKIKSVKKQGDRVYDYSIIYLRKSDCFAMKVEFYMKGSMLKYLVNHDIKIINGILTPGKVIMRLNSNKGETELNIKMIKYNTNIRSALFNKDSL